MNCPRNQVNNCVHKHSVINCVFRFYLFVSPAQKESFYCCVFVSLFLLPLFVVNPFSPVRNNNHSNKVKSKNDEVSNHVHHTDKIK